MKKNQKKNWLMSIKNVGVFDGKILEDWHNHFKFGQDAYLMMYVKHILMMHVPLFTVSTGNKHL